MEATWDTIFRDSTRFWVQFICVPVVVIVGVLGNSVTIYILTRRQMRVSSNVYLTALAISDLIFLVFSFSMSWKHYDCMKSIRLYWNYIPFGLWITDASSSTSVWLTVSFTVERYVAVCHPMWGKKPCTERRAAFVAILVYIICFLLTASTSFEWKSVVAESVVAATATAEGKENETIFMLENTELGKNVWYRLIYHWFSTIFFVLVPLVILAIGNFFLINAVRASRKVREALTNCQFHQRQFQMMHQEDRITVTLIVVIIVFLICQLPTAAVLIYTSMHATEAGSVEENILLGLGNIFNLLVAVNAACNFILYTALSDKYRRVFLNVFCFNSVFHRWYEKKYPRTVYILPRIFPRTAALNVSIAQFEPAFGLKSNDKGDNCVGSSSGGGRDDDMIFSSSGTYHLETYKGRRTWLHSKRCVTFAEEQYRCRCEEVLGSSQGKAFQSI